MKEETQEKARQQESEQQDEGMGSASTVPAGMRRVRLVRSIVLGAKHAEAGSVHDVGQALAHRLVGEGSAEHVHPEKAPTSVNRMVTPGNADPKPRQVSPAPPRGGPKGKDKE